MASKASSRAEEPAAEVSNDAVTIKYTGPHNTRVIGAGDYGNIVIPETLVWNGKGDTVTVSLPEDVVAFLGAEPDLEIV